MSGMEVFAAVVVIVLYFGLAVVAGLQAQRKGLSSLAAFLLCFVISPIAVLLILALLPARAAPATSPSRGDFVPRELPFDLMVQMEQERVRSKKSSAEGA